MVATTRRALQVTTRTVHFSAATKAAGAVLACADTREVGDVISTRNASLHVHPAKLESQHRLNRPPCNTPERTASAPRPEGVPCVGVTARGKSDTVPRGEGACACPVVAHPN